MSNGDLNWIANYIWAIADDFLRDLYVRAKYRDVIRPPRGRARLHPGSDGARPGRPTRPPRRLQVVVKKRVRPDSRVRTSSGAAVIATTGALRPASACRTHYTASGIWIRWRA